MVKVVVAGAAGRMGQRIIHMVRNHPHLELSGAFEAVGHPAIGQDAGAVVVVAPSADAKTNRRTRCRSAFSATFRNPSMLVPLVKSRYSGAATGSVPFGAQTSGWSGWRATIRYWLKVPRPAAFPARPGNCMKALSAATEQWFASRWPERVSRLVLIDAAGYPMAPTEVPARMSISYTSPVFLSMPYTTPLP